MSAVRLQSQKEVEDGLMTSDAMNGLNGDQGAGGAAMDSDGDNDDGEGDGTTSWSRGKITCLSVQDSQPFEGMVSSETFRTSRMGDASSDMFTVRSLLCRDLS